MSDGVEIGGRVVLDGSISGNGYSMSTVDRLTAQVDGSLSAANVEGHFFGEAAEYTSGKISGVIFGESTSGSFIAKTARD
ncbi:transferrin-binding protein-like solute binding protein [Planktomarina temperata]|nr:transferrin-binding protein-like solute binding protein [Planktomarina temperata]